MKINALTAARVRTAPAGRYGDGNGLYLLVRPSNSKAIDAAELPLRRFWIFRWVREGRMREMGLGRAGSDPASTTLAEARERAGQLLRRVRAGIDPLASRQAERAAAKAAAQTAVIRVITFDKVAQDFLDTHEISWKNAKHRQQWTNTLKTYASPRFGSIPVAEVDTEHVLSALHPIWREKPETASRVRGRIESILDYARSRNWRLGENPARWRGHLDNLLPARSKVKKVEHHAALPYSKAPNFLAELREQTGIAAAALEFLILTAGRTSEVIEARWSEIDLVAKIWTIPAERMKAKREHRVPLSDQAVSVLERMAEIRQNGFVFPGQRQNKPLSNMALLVLIRRMKREDLTAHGFRSTFRDWAAERTSYPNEVVEMALAHAISSKVEAAYRRGDLFEKRRALISDWALFMSAK